MGLESHPSSSVNNPKLSIMYQNQFNQGVCKDKTMRKLWKLNSMVISI